MQIASGSRHTLSYVPEATFAVTPATPQFQKLRHNSTTLAMTVAALQSQELRDDRQIAGYRHGIRSAAGDIVSELSYGTLDDFFAYALMGEWENDVLQVGTERNTFTAERRFNDVNQFLRFVGCEINTMSITAQPGAIVPVTFGVVANDAEDLAQAPITGAVYEPSNTNNVMTGLEGGVIEGGNAVGIVSEIQLSLNNGLNPTNVLGSPLSLQQSVGKSALTGTLTAYFADANMYNKFKTETQSSISFTVSDPEGNRYQFEIPRVVYGAAPISVPNDGPITLPMTFQALLSAGANGTNFRIKRFPKPTGP